jgi:hypothetical protein
MQGYRQGRCLLLNAFLSIRNHARPTKLLTASARHVGCAGSSILECLSSSYSVKMRMSYSVKVKYDMFCIGFEIVAFCRVCGFALINLDDEAVFCPMQSQCDMLKQSLLVQSHMLCIIPCCKYIGRRAFPLQFSYVAANLCQCTQTCHMTSNNIICKP